MDLKEAQLKISMVVSVFNAQYAYQDWEPNAKAKQGNCFTFIEEVLYGLEVLPQFKGSLYTFMHEMKTFGSAGPSVYPTDYKAIFEEKFGFPYLPEIQTHIELDAVIQQILLKDKDFRTNFPHDFIVLQSIDLAFWFRSVHDPNEDANDPLFDGEKSLCKCFEESFILSIPQYVEKVQEESKKKKISNVGLRKSSLYDPTMKNSSFGKKFNDTDLKRTSTSLSMQTIGSLQNLLKK
jgi:hypothetical protein